MRQEVVAVEPAAPLRQLLNRKLARADHRLSRPRRDTASSTTCPWPTTSPTWSSRARLSRPPQGHGGDAGLAEMERVCRPGGCVVIVWPNNVGWLAAHGYRYRSFAGEMVVEFASHDEAVELAEIFYPSAAAEVRRRGAGGFRIEVLGVNPPRDLAFKDITR